MVSGNDDAGTAMRLADRATTCWRSALALRGSSAAACASPKRRRQRPGETFPRIDGPHRQPVIGLRARGTRRALDHIHAAHVAGIRIAALGEIAGVSRVPGKSGVQKIGVERNNDVGVLQLVLRFHWLAECHLARRRAPCPGSPAHTHATWPADTASAPPASAPPASAKKPCCVRMRMPAPAQLSARSAGRESLRETRPRCAPRPGR